MLVVSSFTCGRRNVFHIPNFYILRDNKRSRNSAGPNAPTILTEATKMVTLQTPLYTRHLLQVSDFYGVTLDMSFVSGLKPTYERHIIIHTDTHTFSYLTTHTHTHTRAVISSRGQHRRNIHKHRTLYNYDFEVGSVLHSKFIPLNLQLQR